MLQNYLKQKIDFAEPPFLQSQSCSSAYLSIAFIVDWIYPLSPNLIRIKCITVWECTALKMGDLVLQDNLVLLLFVLLLSENVQLLSIAAGQLSYPYWNMFNWQELGEDRCPMLISPRKKTSPIHQCILKIICIVATEGNIARWSFWVH